jgi:large subunit ribosomal protein L15|uniref:Large ribosomal subunit protein uL15 n=1 Tax=candidate division WOR-3 bacterium TaxID=2052148 RepID=A0A7C4UB83_UNCW3
MVELWNLKPPKGAIKSKKRLGRGTGSGVGKTSGRGDKGQKARSGGTKGRGFEGGQMPLIRRLPKKGFSNPFKKVYDIVNVYQLNRFNEGEEVSIEKMKEYGLITGKNPVKILGKGEIEKKLVVIANRFSKSAMEKIKLKGGEVRVI